MAKAPTTTTKAAKEKAAPATSAKSKTSTINPAPKLATVESKETKVSKETAVTKETAASKEAASKETSAPKATTKQVAKASEVSGELISVRAFELFASRGYVHGFDREDWIEAERQLKAELN